MGDTSQEIDAEKSRRQEELTKQLLQNVCICKGIKLSRVLLAVQQCDTVEEVNQHCGSGSGGCSGVRCGPKIKALLKRKHALKEQER